MKSPVTSITEDQLTEIKRLESRIESLREALPYADGQAYYDDKRKIEQMTIELCNLRSADKTGDQQ